ncbi:M15 family metallopeptidase [Salmonella enterica]|nr:D-alanyl-D-alanine dipeptidase [Salmonella enterica]EAN8393864.1 D-alanyl-D-alanine dipeptidase [Salmonella enterica subsp. arizonae serovar 13,23:gz51:-]EBF3615073.1 D-alanyl-D-alanine dipeptidase [Salmonella enterica subsp. arizonae serovar [1],13,23:g,z51:-]EBR4052394.1 M15 family metallopeptidase [Salmonella enterica subsp. enterica]ECJ2572977.1 M15 family metallopeptidase [Salmonella enterica subsp. arizonae]ECL5964498.1 M15 family metallopeptidase [Salmonella enterica subsp. enterica 
MVKRVSSFLLFSLLSLQAMSAETQIDSHRPKDVVDITTVAPDVQVYMRYFTSYNVIGRPIKGYKAPVCLLTPPAANAVKQVADRLPPFGLTLKIYDFYRPQTAVNDFTAMAKAPSQKQMKNEFYPQVDKSSLFEEGYIAAKSSHSRGSTLDLMIVPLDSKLPVYHPGRPLADCAAPAAQRSPDNSLDFGTGFDCFSPLSHPDNALLTAQQRANRLLLQTLMRDAGIIQNGGISPLLMSHTRRLGLTFPLRREPQTTLC